MASERMTCEICGRPAAFDHESGEQIDGAVVCYSPSWGRVALERGDVSWMPRCQPSDGWYAAHLKLRAQVATLTRERDEAREHKLKIHDMWNEELARRENTYAERDSALADAARARQERDQFIGDHRAAMEDYNALQEQLTRSEADCGAMRDWCAGWLIRARMAIYREGWEEGMSESEMTDINVAFRDIDVALAAIAKVRAT